MATIATTSQPTNARLTWVVGLIALSVLLNYVDRGAIGIAAPKMKAELGLSATGFGVAVSAFFWVYAPLCLFVGWLCDRFCVYRIFAAGVAVWAISTALTGFVGGLASLVVLRLFLGLGESIAFPGSSKIFAAQVPAAHRGMANAAVAAALAFGPAVGTLGGGTILAEMGWRPIFWIFGAVTLLWLVPWHFVSAPLRSRTLSSPVVDPAPFGRLLRIPAVWIMGMSTFFSNYGLYFLLAWLPLYMVNVRGYAISEMIFLTTLGFVAQGVTALLSGRMSDMLSARGRSEGAVRRGMMIAGQALMTVSVAGMAWRDTPGVLALWLIMAGMATGLLATNVFAVGQMFGGARRTGGWMGIQNAIGNTSGIIGPVATGLIIDHLGGYTGAFVVTAAVAFVGVLWWCFVVPEIREVEV